MATYRPDTPDSPALLGLRGIWKIVLYNLPNQEEDFEGFGRWPGPDESCNKINGILFD